MLEEAASAPYVQFSFKTDIVSRWASDPCTETLSILALTCLSSLGKTYLDVPCHRSFMGYHTATEKRVNGSCSLETV